MLSPNRWCHNWVESWNSPMVSKNFLGWEKKSHVGIGGKIWNPFPLYSLLQIWSKTQHPSVSYWNHLWVVLSSTLVFLETNIHTLSKMILLKHNSSITHLLTMLSDLTYHGEKNPFFTVALKALLNRTPPTSQAYLSQSLAHSLHSSLHVFLLVPRTCWAYTFLPAFAVGSLRYTTRYTPASPTGFTYVSLIRHLMREAF